MADNNYPLNQAQDDIDNLEQGLIPVAGITAWHKSFTNQSLPNRFVECNGQTISDADSPLDGNSVPDLNGNNRILKGNTFSGDTGSFNTDGDNTSNTEKPFDVVWVMRIK